MRYIWPRKVNGIPKANLAILISVLRDTVLRIELNVVRAGSRVTSPVASVNKCLTAPALRDEL